MIKKKNDNQCNYFYCYYNVLRFEYVKKIDKKTQYQPPVLGYRSLIITKIGIPIC